MSGLKLQGSIKYSNEIWFGWRNFGQIVSVKIRSTGFGQNLANWIRSDWTDDFSANKIRSSWHEQLWFTTIKIATLSRVNTFYLQLRESMLLAAVNHSTQLGNGAGWIFFFMIWDHLVSFLFMRSIKMFLTLIFINLRKSMLVDEHFFTCGTKIFSSSLCVVTHDSMFNLWNTNVFHFTCLLRQCSMFDWQCSNRRRLLAAKWWFSRIELHRN